MAKDGNDFDAGGVGRLSKSRGEAIWPWRLGREKLYKVFQVLWLKRGEDGRYWTYYNPFVVHLLSK